MANHTPNGRQTPAAPRKPYVKPSFKFEQSFETMALTCGKIKNTQASCHQNRKRS